MFIWLASYPKSGNTLVRALIASYLFSKDGNFNFEIIKKKARPGRNPKTGEAVTVSARKVVTFRAGQKLRSKVASQDG